MENQRTILYLAFFFTLFLLYQAWEKDYAPKPEIVEIEQAANSDSQAADSAALPPAAIPAEITGTSSREIPEISADQVSAKTVHVVTDVLDLYIDTKGGTIHQLDLRKYQKSADEMDQPFRLFSSREADFHIAQSGLVTKGFNAPSHNEIYTAKQSEYRLQEGTDSLQVELLWEKEGVKVIKTLTFKRDSYVIDVEHKVQSEQRWVGHEYRQLARSYQESESMMIPTYVGGVVYNDEIKYEKVDFAEIAEGVMNGEMKGGWIAMIQHYFLSSWVPDQQQANLTYSRYLEDTRRYILGIRSPALEAKAGQPALFKSQLVVGPKLQDRLEVIAPGLELTVDYGILTILSKPLFWLLKWLHALFDNWGWAIIFLTIIVKVLFYKLSEVGYRSMAKMRKITPRLQTLKERYGDDRQRMSAEMMKMYKEEKINPLGGCLPILIQIPVFIALYWVLLESVEMRNAPFALWIQNLSVQDPYYVLPLLMGLTMYIQQKLNPAPVDPVQQKIFQYMPIVFTAFFLLFPAGLVLYWVVNNTLSIAQQWIITRRIESEA